MSQPARRPDYTREPAARRRTTGSVWLWVGGLILAGLIGWWIWAAVAQDETAGPEAAVTVSDIQNEPSAFIGENVTVSGQVANVLGEGRMIVGDEDADSFILVVGAQGAPNVTEDTLVQVTGTVREFDLETFEEEFGAFEPGFEDEFVGDGLEDGVEEGAPAIVASRVQVLDQAGETAE